MHHLLYKNDRRLTRMKPMKPPRKTWANHPPRPIKPRAPDSVKRDVEAKARELIESFFKPAHVHPPPTDSSWNYVVDIYSRWYRNYFYFCSKYASPGPNAISPFFETKFARMEYMPTGRFNLAYYRYTGQWLEVFTDLSLEECLEMIEKGPWFNP